MQMDLLNYWGLLFSALLRDQHFNNISNHLIFSKINTKFSDTKKMFVEVPDNLNSTLAMTSYTLNHSTPDFTPVLVRIQLSLR